MESFKQAMAAFKSHSGGDFKWPRDGFQYTRANQSPLPIEPDLLQRELQKRKMQKDDLNRFLRGLVLGLNWQWSPEDDEEDDLETKMNVYWMAYGSWDEETDENNRTLTFNEPIVHHSEMSYSFTDHTKGGMQN